MVDVSIRPFKNDLRVAVEGGDVLNYAIHASLQ